MARAMYIIWHNRSYKKLNSKCQTMKTLNHIATAFLFFYNWLFRTAVKPVSAILGVAGNYARPMRTVTNNSTPAGRKADFIKFLKGQIFLIYLNVIEIFCIIYR